MDDELWLKYISTGFWVSREIGVDGLGMGLMEQEFELVTTEFDEAGGIFDMVEVGSTLERIESELIGK